jgi:excisionase family DNA binding protein
VTKSPDALLTAEQVAERLSISHSHTQRLMARGDLEVVRIGRRAVRVTESAVEEFIASRTHSARPAIRRLRPPVDRATA